KPKPGTGLRSWLRVTCVPANSSEFVEFNKELDCIVCAVVAEVPRMPTICRAAGLTGNRITMGCAVMDCVVERTEARRADGVDTGT
ncbi:MAG: hypothetical protein ACREDR_27590, partial [Blastocatellia bacterium]